MHFLPYHRDIQDRAPCTNRAPEKFKYDETDLIGHVRAMVNINAKVNMKNTIRRILLSVGIIMFPSLLISTPAQTTRDIILSAMKDELARNMEQLQLENLQRPFFISYTVRDFTTVSITATLGALIDSDVSPVRNYNVRVMVGDYKMTDENFQDSAPSDFQRSLLQGTDELPIEDDYFGIRRALWISTDRVYKSASEKFERKKATLAQQQLTEEERSLDDFSRASVVKYDKPAPKFVFDRARWEGIVRDISALFKAYPDIYSSQVGLKLIHGNSYFVNSEGTEVIQPLRLASIVVHGSSQAIDGEWLSDVVFFLGLGPEDLPSPMALKQETMALIERLLALRRAPAFDGAYTGPVMFEGSAVAELMAQYFFEQPGGLLAFRTPVMAGLGRSQSIPSQSLEDKIGTRILSRDLTITAEPALSRFGGTRLIGSFEIDEEGVVPPKKIVLVENGILKALLSNRIPTPKIRSSNGHERPMFSTGRFAGSRLGPGVIVVSTNDGKAPAEMKTELLKLAEQEGLEYAIIIRKMMSLTRPRLFYRVRVADGSEEPIRSATLGRLTSSSFRRISAACSEQVLYQKSGIPASYIVPSAIIFDELELEPEKRTFTPKLPVVPSPLMTNQ